MFLVYARLAAVEVAVGIAVETEVEFLAVGLGVVLLANSANQTCCVIRPAARLWRGQDVNQRRACIILSQQGNRCKKPQQVAAPATSHKRRAALNLATDFVCLRRYACTCYYS